MKKKNQDYIYISESVRKYSESVSVYDHSLIQEEVKNEDYYRQNHEKPKCESRRIFMFNCFDRVQNQIRNHKAPDLKLKKIIKAQ